MMDATGRPQSVLVLGANSDIAAAALRVWAKGPLAAAYLGVRDPADSPEIAGELTASGCEVHIFRFDAAQASSHLPELSAVFHRAGDVDVGLIAFGILRDQGELEEDPASAELLMTVNATATVVASLALAKEMKKQGHGVIVVISSLSGQRPRRDNYVYGASKAAVDAHGRGLAAALEGSGVDAVVVRLGFVRSKMTEGMAEAPFAVSAERAAESIVKAVRLRRTVTWVPWVLGPMFAVLRLLPEAAWRRLAKRLAARNAAS